MDNGDAPPPTQFQQANRASGGLEAHRPCGAASTQDRYEKLEVSGAQRYSVRPIVQPALSGIGSNHPVSGALAPVDEAAWATATYAKGAHFDGDKATFALYSKHAARVLLEVYTNPNDTTPKGEYWMERGPDDVWRAKVGSVPSPAYYGFRLWGPNWPFDPNWQRGGSAAGFISDVDTNGNRFDPNKPLQDPYAREITHDKETPDMLSAGEDSTIYDSGSLLYHGTRARREIDTARWAPKGVVFRDDTTSFGTKPHLAEQDAIICEAHVRGITRDPSCTHLTDILAGVPGFADVRNVPDEYRGTYKGAGYMAAYLKARGINRIEFLPMQESDNDINDVKPGGANYWGYMTRGYFAPDRRYAFDNSPGGPTREFKEMVKAFHDAGIEVCMDVVYNHTVEGGLVPANDRSAHYQRFKSLSRQPEVESAGNDVNTAEITEMRGIDNQEYYTTIGGQQYWDSSGCGNNLDASHPVVQDLIVDSLKYWSEQMGVDCFRFDEAAELSRGDSPDHPLDPGSPFLAKIASLGFTVIAEPWDCNGSLQGQMPRGWSEWNGAYRVAMRKFLKSDGNIEDFMTAFTGSDQSFRGHGGPQKSINNLDTHDGFALADDWSFNEKNNNQPFAQSDGGDCNNDSWDCADGRPLPAIQALRRKQIKNSWTTLMFSRGTPMMVAGDEFGRTQFGNNNAYNLDTPVSWLDYNQIHTDAPTLEAYRNELGTPPPSPDADKLGTDSRPNGQNTLFPFSAFVTHLRRQHPALRQASYEAVPIEFRSPDGSPWNSSVRRSVQIAIDGNTVGDNRFLLLANSDWQSVGFQVPPPAPGKKWVRIIDTGSWAEQKCDNFWVPGAAAEIAPGSYTAEERSQVVLMEVAAKP